LHFIVHGEFRRFRVEITYQLRPEVRNSMEDEQGKRPYPRPQDAPQRAGHPPR
jgi:hypothetical protein